MATPSAAGEHDDRVGIVYAVTLTFWVLAMLVVGMRMYSRVYLTKFCGADDWLMLAAATFSSGDETIKLIWCKYGLGKHVSQVPLHDISIFAKLAYAIAFQYPWSLGLVKMSILAFYLRVFPSDNFRKLCYAVMVIVACITIAVSLGQAFACSPISAAWSLNSLFQKSHCANKQALQYSANALNLVTDLVVLLMPMKYLVSLSVNGGRRFHFIVLFSLGLLACIASGIRISTIHTFYQNTDPTWYATNIAIWSAVEINLTIITASIPAIKPFFEKFVRSPIRTSLLPLTSTSTRSNSKSGISFRSFSLSSKKKKNAGGSMSVSGGTTVVNSTIGSFGGGGGGESKIDSGMNDRRMSDSRAIYTPRSDRRLISTPRKSSVRDRDLDTITLDEDGEVVEGRISRDVPGVPVEFAALRGGRVVDGDEVESKE